MKTLIGLIVTMFALTSFAAEPAKKEEAKAPAKVEVNCVTKDKKGNCPTPPKGDKPKPKHAEKKAKAAASAASSPKVAAKK